MEIADFFDLIYGDTEGHIAIVSKNEETGLLDIHRWLSWTADRRFAVKYVGLRESEDTYATVSVFSTEQRSKEDPFAKARVVWIDSDTCAPENYRLKPSIITQSSPDKWQCWWVLDKEYSAKECERIAQKVSLAHRDQGADKGFDLTRILRIPGTTNSKYATPHAVTAIDTGERYTLDDLAAAYADIDAEATTAHLGDVPDPVDDNRLRDLELMLETAGLGDLYVRKPEPGQSWSERLYRLELDSFRLGMTPVEVFTVALNAACNKFDPTAAGEQTQSGVTIPRRRNPEAVVWADVQKAYNEYVSTQDVPVEDTPGSVAGAVSFLSTDERRLVEDNPTWIDRYTQWAMTRSPDGVPDYQRSMAYLVLSMCFADRVMVPLTYGDSYPNLWTMIAGLSTLDRKTTAMNLGLKVLHGVEDLSGDQIDIGSDATTEALVMALGKRDKEASLLYTDEVYDFFNEIYVKNYRMGTMGKFTDLYGGNVPVALRATKGSGNTVRARTAFGFLGVGVKSRIAQVLTRDSFESGFLLRMTWTVADERKYKRGDSHITMQDPDAHGNYDNDIVQLAMELFDKRERYDRENPQVLRFTPEALARLNQFVDDLHESAIEARDATLAGGMDRLRDSVMKSAALLAAFDRLDEIDEFCVLAAIRQGEVWYKGLVEMLNAVSTSAFGSLCDKVLAYVVSSKNHEVLESSIYKQFKFKPSEFNEVIAALIKQGQVKRVDGTKFRALV